MKYYDERILVRILLHHTMATNIQVVKNNFLRMAKVLTNVATRTKSPLWNEITEIYLPNVNKRKMIEILKEKARQATQSQVAHKMRTLKGYYTLEMAPPSTNEMKKIQSDLALVKEFINSGCYKYLTVRQAWLLLLVCTEVGLWFFMGETIGKMSFVGYKV